MATLPQLTDGTKVDAAKWNAHVDQINTNTNGISTLETRTTDANTGNTALGNRVGTVETRTTDASTGNTALGDRVTKLETLKKTVLRKSANQSIAHATDTIVTWDVTDLDVGTMKSGNNIVVPAGNYWIAAQIRWPGNANGSERVAYIVDYSSGSLASINTKVLAGLVQAPLNTGAGNLMSFGRAFKFTGTTTLCVVVYQNTGAALDISYTDFGGCAFSVTTLP